MKEHDEREASENSVCLGHLSALLKVDEDGVLAELFVELGVVLSGPVLSLNEEWVLLDLLSCGHRYRLRGWWL